MKPALIEKKLHLWQWSSGEQTPTNEAKEMSLINCYVQVI